MLTSHSVNSERAHADKNTLSILFFCFFLDSGREVWRCKCDNVVLVPFLEMLLSRSFL